MKKLLIVVGLLVSSTCLADGIYFQLPGINFGIGSTPRYYFQPQYYSQPQIVYEQPIYVERPVYYERVVPVYRNWYGKEEHRHEGHHHGHHDRD